MPTSIPIGKADQALASSTSGAIVVSAGAGAVPTADATHIRIESGKLALDSSSVDGSGRIAMSLESPTRPYNWVSQASPQVDSNNNPIDPNVVVSLGHNLGPTGRIDDTKPYFRDGWEQSFWINYNGPWEYFSERHVGSLGWSDGQEIRMLSMICGQTTRKASGTFQLSALSAEDEARTGVWLGNSVDVSGGSVSSYLAVPGQAHTLDVQGTATQDNLVLGRGSKDSTVFINGTTARIALQESGVETFNMHSVGGVLYLKGGDLGFFDFANHQSQINTNLTVGANGTLKLIDSGGGNANITGNAILAINSDNVWIRDKTGVNLLASFDPTTSTVTLSGKLTVPSRDGTVKANTDAATVTFDCKASDKHTLTMNVAGANRTLALSNDTVGQQFTLFLKQDGTGGRTVTWWSGIKWAGGSPPTLSTAANAEDGFVFIKRGTGDYRGHVAGQGYA